MSDKLSPGDSPHKGPLNSRAWNRVVESSDDYHSRRGATGGVRSLLGSSPYRPPKAVFDYRTRVQAQNNTGYDLRQGEVVELDEYVLAERDNSTPWFSGQTPDLSRIGWGVMLEPVKHLSGSGEIQYVGPCMLLGCCLAYVNVTDANHQYAKLAAGSRVLASSAVGAVKILDKPTGTGELECWVLLGCEPSLLLGKTDAAISKGSSGTVSIWSGTPGSETDTGDNITAFNRFANLGSGKWVACSPINGHYYLTSAEC